MKKVFNFISIILFAVVSLTFISCGDDDDNGGGMANNPLIGEWAYIYEEGNSLHVLKVYNFKENGELIVTYYDHTGGWEEFYSYGDHWYYYNIYKYSVSGNTVTITGTRDGKQIKETLNWTSDVEPDRISLYFRPIADGTGSQIVEITSISPYSNSIVKMTSKIRKEIYHMDAKKIYYTIKAYVNMKEKQDGYKNAEELLNTKTKKQTLKDVSLEEAKSIFRESVTSFINGLEITPTTNYCFVFSLLGSKDGSEDVAETIENKYIYVENGEIDVR